MKNIKLDNWPCFCFVYECLDNIKAQTWCFVLSQVYLGELTFNSSKVHLFLDILHTFRCITFSTMVDLENASDYYHYKMHCSVFPNSNFDKVVHKLPCFFRWERDKHRQPQKESKVTMTIRRLCFVCTNVVSNLI